MLLLLLTTLSLACPRPVTPDEVVRLAEEAWDAGAGPGWRARIEGLDAAARAVAVGPSELRVEAQLGHPGGDQLLGVVDIPLTAGTLQRRLWRATADEARAEAEADRWAFVDEVHATWARWWLADRFRGHLEHYTTEVDDELSGLREAAGEGLLSRIDLDDLTTELASVRAETAAWREEAAVARAGFEALVRTQACLPPAEEEELSVPLAANPWLAVQDHLARHPVIAAATASVDRAQAAVRATRAEGVPVLWAGAMGMQVGSGAPRVYAPLAIVGLSVPLQAGGASDRRALRGEATAAELDRAWLVSALAGELQTEAQRHEAAAQRLDRVRTEVVQPLQAREDRLEAALREGLVSADRVVRARRDRHHAEHELIEVATALAVGRARAAALARAMEVVP